MIIKQQLNNQIEHNNLKSPPEKTKFKIEDLKSYGNKLETSTKSKSSILACPEIPQNGVVYRSDKAEYDLKPEEVEEVEKLTNSKIICNIGYGGFSTVKLIFSYTQKVHYAMKVVSKNRE